MRSYRRHFRTSASRRQHINLPSPLWVGGRGLHRCEPSFIGHKRSVDHAVGIGDNHDELSTFRATMSNDQRNVCQRFGTEYMPPEANQKVGISLGSLENVPLHAVRLSPENGTCGWYIYGGAYSPDADFYQPLHVAHLIERCPNIIPYLALPPGWRVLLAPDYEDVWFDGELLKNVIDSL